MVLPFPVVSSCRGLEGPQAPVGVTDRHLLGPVMNVLERRDHLEGRIGTERVCVSHPQHDPRVGLPVLGDLGDEHAGTVAVAELPGVVVRRKLQLVSQRLEKLRCLAPVVSRQEQASIPSVAMSALLLGRWLSGPMGVVEVGAQRVSDQRRQRHLRLDSAVLDLLDQPDRQIHVELLDFLITHKTMLTC